jgi:hypothetical protein
MDRRIRNLIVDLAAGFGLLAGLLGLVAAVGGWFMWNDWVPQATLDRLPGASKTEVRAMLGEPDCVADSASRWDYRRAFRLAEFRVHFDETGRAEHWSYDR